MDFVEKSIQKVNQLGAGGGGGTDSKYFQTTKKGEIHELREELANPKMEKKKEAVKKVIAAMTVGKDVSMLFTDVVNCIQTVNIELKKLVYLYLINYAKSQPDLAILAVNTFVKDTQDVNPLIRALAVRTMGCIRVDKIVEYLCEPLRKCLKDEDPYVRKTSAVCVAKLYDINGELVEDQGFLDMVYDLLGDSNPMVVSNAVAALAEISETSELGQKVFQINTSTLQKMLAALNECTEWGQVFILDSLALYCPSDGREAESIIERVTPRLQHANSAVVLSAVKVMIKYMDLITSQDTLKALYKKMAPPLVTLLSSEPEIQYVALRNINLIVQKRPTILAHEIKVFFSKYNDPIYVKMEKLEIMIKLASERNVDQVLMELKEYATEVDVEFVRRSVRAIGRCAIKLERAAERCINVLLELIQTKVNYVVQEAVIVIKDIFRKFPNRYESIIGTLCENLDTLDEPEAKGSMIWIIGEYAERIDNADELLESFLESFDDETASVQLQMLTATVKLFLKRPAETQKMVQDVLTLATQDSDNPDLRDRGYIYWRLLSTDPEAAKQVVLAEKPNINDDSFTLDPSVLDELITHLSTLASIYHKPPSTFITGRTRMVPTLGGGAHDDEYEESDANITSDMMDGGMGGAQAAPPAMPAPSAGGLADLLGLDDEIAAPAAGGGGMGGAASLAPPGMADLFGGPPAPAPAAPSAKVVLPPDRGEGMQVRSAFVAQNGRVFQQITIENHSPAPLSGFAIQYNKNSFGLVPESPGALGQVMPPQLAPGQSHTGLMPLTATGQPQDSKGHVQMAIKNNVKVFYFQDQCDVLAFLSADGRVERGAFLEQWKSIAQEAALDVQGIGPANENVDSLCPKLEASNVFFIARRKLDGGADMLYFSVKTLNGVVMLAEIGLRPGQGMGRVVVKAQQTPYVSLLAESLKAKLLS
ncbi:Adaptor protein 2 beta subunit 1 [Emiliania huxleyi CCMP1516]|uniref:Beta-adaptin appendage C-terminal subdomain domain-containing protein n=10 Tax=Emiliania huxleyi TaxID=2903 RepID=A0A0D3IUQ0_EMIH1|nr:Adaptor protein 2 beta subunit 1 [Emiliania huxleyi CCMP1516]EOD14985.1 Adaptor protein 2 beta subunit 1 [Emiliania huxleyi CCMP1516]|eukprot:XP_005767414.1 Adaptor protein 2 beta subunit 1 [Emiliania huxleyi CCMP1516]